MLYAGRKYKILCIIALTAVVCMLCSIQITAVFAAENTTDFEQTDVLEDLLTSEINGNAFEITDYPYNESGNVRIIAFVEYCYSYRVNLRENYGLYLYIYNPKGIEIDDDSLQNTVQMAVRYDEGGKPVEYEKFALKLCSKVEKGDYKGLFYKFKIIDHPVDGKYFAQRVNSNARRYDLSGIELLTEEETDLIDYALGGTYIFTGYAKGYGADVNAESTLECRVLDVETVSLSVKHTFYRSETSSLGVGHRNQLDTVYFSVPKRLIDDYGKLQRIKAEWYEYKTREILVTSNKDFYNITVKYIGKPVGSKKNTNGLYEYNADVSYSLGINAGDWGGGVNAAKWGWNLGSGYLHKQCNVLYYMFLVNEISTYDPYSIRTSNGKVECSELYEWIRSYDKSFEHGRLAIKNGSISADLFCEDIDESRKIDSTNGKIQMGYSYYDFDADVDTLTLSSWSENNPSFWENWINFGLGAAFKGGVNEESRTVPPIQILRSEDLIGTDSEIAERLLISITDVDRLKKDFSDAVTVDNLQDEEQVVVLFRFATSDYYSEYTDIIQLGKGLLGSDKHISGEAYIAQESVFLDFDIIQLTFNKEGDYTVIPAVSSPIDIVNDITSPINSTLETPFWQIIAGAILGLLLIILLYPLLSCIFQGIFCLLSLPFRK